MKDKILNLIHKKLCEGFNTTFLPRTQFEKEFAEQEDSLLESVNSLTKTYFQLIESENPEVVKITKGQYIIDQFNFKNRNSSKYSIEDLEVLKQKFKDDIEDHEDQYDRYIENGNKEYVTALISFINDRTAASASKNETKTELSIESLFWEHFHKNYLENRWGRMDDTNKIINSADLIIKEFREQYLSNRYLNLLDLADKNISDENLSTFDEFIVNVGKRHYVNGHSGWSTSTFQIFNNGAEYNFSYSAKDEKRIQGDCINIFIFQSKYLIKVSVTLGEEEGAPSIDRTPYIIHKDCEKMTLKNDCELVIVKHHGNETIIFDTRKEALAFQTKLIEIREGRKFK